MEDACEKLLNYLEIDFGIELIRINNISLEVHALATDSKNIGIYCNSSPTQFPCKVLSEMIVNPRNEIEISHHQDSLLLGEHT